MITRPSQVIKYQPTPLLALAQQTFIETNQHLIRIVHNIRQNIRKQNLDPAKETKILDKELLKHDLSKLHNPSNFGDLTDLNYLWLQLPEYITRKDGVDLCSWYLNLNDARLDQMNNILFYADLNISTIELENPANYVNGKFQVPAWIWTKKNQMTLNVLRELASEFGTFTSKKPIVEILNDYANDQLLDYFPKNCLKQSIQNQQWKFFELFYPICKTHSFTADEKVSYINTFCMQNQLQLCELLIQDVNPNLLYFDWSKNEYSNVLRILQTGYPDIIIWTLKFISCHMVNNRLFNGLNDLTWQVFTWALACDQMSLFETTIVKNLHPNIDWDSQKNINPLTLTKNSFSEINTLYIELIATYLSPLINQTQKLQQLKHLDSKELYTLQRHAINVGNLELFDAVYTILDHEQKISLLKYDKYKLITDLAEFGYLNYLQLVFNSLEKKDILSAIEADNWATLRLAGQNKHWPIIDYLEQYLEKDRRLEKSTLAWLTYDDKYKYFIDAVKTNQVDLSSFIWNKLLPNQKILALKCNDYEIIKHAAKWEKLDLFKSMLETWLINRATENNLTEKQQLISGASKNYQDLIHVVSANDLTAMQLISAVLSANNLTAIQLAWNYILPTVRAGEILLTGNSLYIQVQLNNSNSVEWIWSKINPAIHHQLKTDYQIIVKILENQNLSLLKLFLSQTKANDKIKMLMANQQRILITLMRIGNAALLEYFCENIPINKLRQTFNLGFKKLIQFKFLENNNIQFLKLIVTLLDPEQHQAMFQAILEKLLDDVNLYSGYSYFYFLQWTINQCIPDLINKTLTSRLANISSPILDFVLSLKPELDQGLILAERLYRNRNYLQAKNLLHKFLKSKDNSIDDQMFALQRFCTIIYSNSSKKEKHLTKYAKYFNRACTHNLLDDEITEAFFRMMYLQNKLEGNIYQLPKVFLNGVKKNRSCSAEYYAHFLITHHIPSSPVNLLHRIDLHNLHSIVYYYNLAIENKLSEPNQPNSSALDELYIWRALAHIRRSNLDMALDDLNMAMSSNPNNVNAYAYVSLVHILRSDLQTAMHYINNALTLEPNNLLAIFYRAKAHMQVNNHLAVTQDLDTLKQIEPKNHMVYFYQALHNWQISNFPQALHDFYNSMKLKYNYLTSLKYYDNNNLLEMRQLFFADLKNTLLKQPTVIASSKIDPAAIYDFFTYLHQITKTDLTVQYECAQINFKIILSLETSTNLLEHLMRPLSDATIFEFICKLNLFDKEMLRAKLFQIISHPTDKYAQLIQHLTTIFNHEELYNYNNTLPNNLKRTAEENGSRKLLNHNIFAAKLTSQVSTTNSSSLSFRCIHTETLKHNTVIPNNEANFVFTYDLDQLFFIVEPKFTKPRSWIKYFNDKLDFYQSETKVKLSEYIHIIRIGNSKRYEIIGKSPVVKLDLSQPTIIAALKELITTPSSSLKKICPNISFTIINRTINNISANDTNSNRNIINSFSM